MIFLPLALALTIAAEQPPAQNLLLDSILVRSDRANTAVMDSLKNYSYEFTEKMIFNELDDEGNIKKADTTISQIKTVNGEESSRTVIYSTSKDKSSEKNEKNGDDNQMSASFSGNLKPDDPDYAYGLVDSTDECYVISVTPRKAKPDKDQIRGKYFIDKNSFLFKSMDMETPRPEKLKELKMKVSFKRLPEGPYVITNMEMAGRVKALLGIVNIKFKLVGEFYDYKVIGENVAGQK